MTDRRPDCVYGILVQGGKVFLRHTEHGWGLPGGAFPPMADHRKHELRAVLWDQLGIDAAKIWAQGAFDYEGPGDTQARFSGFYSVWEWEGEVPEHLGAWVGQKELGDYALPSPLRILLFSVLSTEAMRTS